MSNLDEFKKKYGIETRTNVNSASANNKTSSSNALDQFKAKYGVGDYSSPVAVSFPTSIKNTPTQMSATPTFKTPEEALAYANQNNIKVANTNVFPKVAGLSVEPKKVTLKPQVELAKSEKETSFWDRLGNAGLSNEQANQINEQINNTDNFITNVLKDSHNLSNKVKDTVVESGKTLGKGAAVGVTNIYDYAKAQSDMNARVSNTVKSTINVKDLYNYDPNAQSLSYLERLKRGQIKSANALGELEILAKNSDSLKELYNQILNGTFQGTEEDLERAIYADELEKIEKDRAKTQWARDMYAEQIEKNAQLGPIASKIANASGTVGNMLPTIGATMINPALGKATLFANSAGGAYNQAIENGALPNEAGLNATLSGGMELATEMIGGEKMADLTGLPTLTKKLNLIPDSKAGKFLLDLGSEVLEEFVNTTFQPLIDRATYDKDAPMATKEDYWNTFIDTAFSTVLLMGVSDGINAVNNYKNKAIEKIEQSEMTTEQKEQAKIEVQKGADEIIEQVKNNQLNNTNIAQTSPNNEQISQNNVQNVSNLENTVQNDTRLALPSNDTVGSISRQELLDLSKNFKHKGKTFIDERYKEGNKESSNIVEYNEVELKEDNINLLRKLANSFAKKKYSDAVVKNTDTGIDAVVGKKGIRETLSKDINKEKLSSMNETLIKSIEEAIYKESSLDTDSKDNIYHYLVSMIQNGKKEKALNYITIKETPNRTKFYYNTVEKIEDSMLPSRPGNNTGVVVNATNEPSVNNIIPNGQNYVNNQRINLPTQAQQQAEQEAKRSRIPKLEDIADLTQKDADLPSMKYRANKDKNTAFQRKFFENMETSKIISDKVKEQVTMTTYEQKKNLETLEKVKENLDTDINKVASEWFRKDIKKATDEDVALGAILVERYQQEGMFEEAVDVVQKLADMGTEAGRTVQMYSIFQRLTPEGMMIYQQRKLSSALETLTQKQTGKWVEQNKDKFKLTEDDVTFITAKVQEAQNAPTERQKQIALAEIEKQINDKLPPEAGQSVKAFRRIAMLLNPKTQVRNIAGNVTVMPLNYVTDLVATGIDKAVAKKTGVRTTALPNVKTIARGAKKGWNETWDDYKRGIRTTPTGSKYEIQNNVKSFNENTNSKIKNAINKKLNGIDRLLSSVMEAGDRPFYEAAYQNSLETQMKANGFTEPTQEMIDIASNVALSQTWQDNNNYTQAVLGIRSAFNKININGFGLGDLIIPFAKTPANLTKAMVDYSPAGLIPSIINYNDMRKAISRGEMTAMQQKKFVTSVGKAVAGTLLYVLAGALVKGGKITGSADEDKDVANFEKNVLGIQPYSIKIGDKTFTYNWAQPLATPLAIMSDTYKMSEEGAKWNEILVNAFKVAGDQLVANSFLQGIQELLSSEYGNESAMDNLVGAIMDLPTQFTPTLLGQIATQFDSTKRQTFENGDTVGTMWNEVKNKIPGAKNTLAPQVNTFGEEIQNYGGDNNPFNVFLNPGNISSTNATETQKELYKLYQDTKDKTIFPAQAPYSISGGGEKVTLSSQDRADYQKRSGQFVSENLEALFDSEYYKTLDNDKKAEVVNEIVTDANTLAKGEYLETKASKELKEKLSKLGDIPYVEYYNAWSATRGIESDKNWKGESISGSKKKKQIQAINNATSKNLTNKQRETLYGLLNVSGY